MNRDTRRMFIGMPLRIEAIDLYTVRTSIEKALRGALPHFHGTFLDVGCGEQPYRSLITAPPSRVDRYIGLDLFDDSPAAYARSRPDITWNGDVIPLEDASVDSAMATEVLEHCPDPATVLSEVFRVLRPGGAFFFTVPFLWPLHDVPYDEFRYTPFAMKRLLSNAGFTSIEVRPTGGWNASLAQMIGLYIARASMGERKRRILARLAIPVMRQLLKKDVIPDPMKKPMITGLSGIAYRR